jgi:hypothetical protein
MIKVALNNNQNFVVKRCPNRRARINIILASQKLKEIHPPNVIFLTIFPIKIQEKTKSLNFNTTPSHISKFSTFISGINLVVQQTFKSPNSQEDFLQAFCDNSQYKITKSQRKVKSALNFSKNPDNYEMISLLRNSFINLVGKYFTNVKTEIYLKEIIFLLTKLDLLPKFVTIQAVVDVFVGLLILSIGGKGGGVGGYIRKEEFGLGYENCML